MKDTEGRLLNNKKMVVNSFENSISDGKKDANIKGFTIRKLSFSEEETATHSSILTGIIPWTEEPDRLQSMGSQRIRHDLESKQHQAKVQRSCGYCL